MEETASRYGGQLSRGQPTSSGPPALGLDVGLTTPHRKDALVTKCHKRPRTLINSLDKRPKLRKTEPLGTVRRRWVDNIKMGLREVGWNGGGMVYTDGRTP
jgi:hypothetical protein